MLECTHTLVRRDVKQVLARYDFRFTQEGTLIYEGDQTALWMQIDGRKPHAEQPPAAEERG